MIQKESLAVEGRPRRPITLFAGEICCLLWIGYDHEIARGPAKSKVAAASHSLPGQRVSVAQVAAYSLIEVLGVIQRVYSHIVVAFRPAHPANRDVCTAM